MISERVKKIAPSETLEAQKKATELKAKGIKVFDFGIGEPDFDTPSHIKEAAKKAIDAGYTKYTSAGGAKDLCEAICKKFERDNSLHFLPEQVHCSNGAKQLLFNAFFSLLNDGEEVIVAAPYWVSYLEQIKLAGGIPIIAETGKDFQLSARAIEEKISDKTKLLLLNSPCNPTGAVIEKKELKKIAELAVEKDLFVVSDEVYEAFVFDEAKHYSIASFGEEIANRTLTINAVSKTYAMTGWRLGYAAGPKKLIKAMNSLQGQTASNPNSIAQKAAITALTGPQDCVKEMIREYEKRRAFVIKKFSEIAGFELTKPNGAFYAFPFIDNFFGKTVSNSKEFCNYLLEKSGVVLVQGSAFGKEECARLSYARPMQELEQGFAAIEKAVKTMQ